MHFEVKDWVISAHFLPAILDHDCVALSGDELKMLDNWMDYATESWSDGNEQEWVYTHAALLDNTDEIGQCEITNMCGHTQTLRLHFVMKR